MRSYMAQYLDVDAEDAPHVQRLGAALILMWDSIPQSLREQLLQQAADVGGTSEPPAQRDLAIKAVIKKCGRRKIASPE
jgi:hypothetical protein